MMKLLRGRFTRRYLIAAVASLCLSLVPAAAQTPDANGESAEPPVEDPRADYVVGFAQLSGSGLAPEYRYISSSLPRLVFESLDFGSGPQAQVRHYYPDLERISYAERLIEQQKKLALRAVTNAVRQRDLLLFEIDDQQARREQAEENVSEAAERLDLLENLDPATLEIAREKPLLVWTGNNLGRLLEPAAVDETLQVDEQSLERISGDADLDLLIWGTVEEIQGYLDVYLYAYSPYTRESVSIAGTTALPSEIGRFAGELSPGVASVVIGRPSGTVRISTNVDDAAIYMDDRLVGYREATARFVDPGEVTVVVEAEGYQRLQRSISVRESETIELDLELDPVEGRLVRIESAPSESDVYVDSVWAGRTPMEVRLADTPQVVRLRQDGYLESRFVLDRDSPDRVARVLLPDTVSWADEMEQRRSAFYRSLTGFVLSVPVTMLLNGVYQDVFGAFPPEDAGELLPENRRSFGQLGNTFYWASVGGLLVNVALLVNAGINLFAYLDVGEGAHNQ